MNVYNAIMQAADHIERHPEEFLYRSCTVPKAPGCGTPGCALGWIGCFAGQTSAIGLYDGVYDGISIVARGSLHQHFDRPPVLPITAMDFYSRMDKLTDSQIWRVDHNVCAASLRLYAKKYHASEKPQRRSDSELVADLKSKLSMQTVSTEAVSEELTW